MEKKRKKDKSKIGSFFRIRKKIPKSGKVMKSKKDKEKEKRVTHRDLIKVIEQ